MFEVRINLPKLTKEFFNEHTGGIESVDSKYNRIDDIPNELLDKIVEKFYSTLLTERDIVLDKLYELGFSKIDSPYQIEFDVKDYTWIVRFSHNHPYPARIVSTIYETVAFVINYITTEAFIYIE